MNNSLIDRLRRYLAADNKPDTTPVIKEVEIPVEGIKDGVIYEKEVRPEGYTLIYTELNVDSEAEEQADSQEDNKTSADTERDAVKTNTTGDKHP